MLCRRCLFSLFFYPVFPAIAHLSVMKPLKLDGTGLPPAPSPLAVPSTHAPHINESPYWGALRATVN